MSKKLYCIAQFRPKEGKFTSRLSSIMTIILLFFVSINAEEFDCKKLDDEAKKYFHRVYIGEVIGKERAQFYSAPDKRCAIKGKFIIKGDGVGVYSEYGEFSQIIYTAGTEEDAGVWVYSNRINILSKPDSSPSSPCFHRFDGS